MDTRAVSMDTKGVMQQIREYLAQGKSTAEIIALGYKAGTVFKVQRHMRRRGLAVRGSTASGPRPEIAVATAPPANTAITGSTTLGGATGVAWHPEPPVACPGCGKLVRHWDICPLCNQLLPAACACPKDSPPTVEGYTFHQLLEVSIRRR